MKNLLIIFLLLPILAFSQSRKGTSFYSATDTNAWKSEIRFGNIRGNISSQTNLQNALNAKENVISSGSTGQYWRGDKSWQALNSSVVGLGNVLNVQQEPAISAGTTAQYWRGDKTWQPISSLTGNYIEKFAGQARQSTVTTSGFYAGLESLSGLGDENYNSLILYNSQWNSGLALQSHQFSDSYYIRRRSEGTWLPWKQLALKDYVDTQNSTLNSSITTINSDISNINSKTTAFAYTYNNLREGTTVQFYQIHRFGPVVNMSVYFSTTYTTANNTFVKLFDISSSAAYPTQAVYGPMSPSAGSLYETGSMYVATDGGVWVNIGKANNLWAVNLTWIQFYN